MSTTIKITDLTELTTPNSNTLNTVFVVVDKSSGIFTTKQLSLANLDIAIDNVASFAYTQANSAFTKANSANVLAQSAFNAANTAQADASGAFAKANTAFANYTGEAAFALANTANTIANSGYAFANTVNIKVDSAYAFANTVNIKTDAAFSLANTVNIKTDAAFTKANSANILAQAAFDTSNTFLSIPLLFSATTILEVTANGTTSYRFGQYGALDNPNISTFSATTLGFNLNSLSGSHPFYIRLGDNSADFNTGLAHVSSTGTISYDSAAQGKTSGTLFWRIPHTSVGNYKYRCSSHSGSMIGEINIANTANIYFAYNS